MANINIPASVVPGIKEIGLLNQKESDLLIDKLRAFSKGTRLDDMENSFRTFLDNERANLISGAIYSFGYLLVRNENQNGELADNLTKSFLASSKDDEVSQGLEEIILDRLRDILVLSDFLVPVYEAYRVLWEGNSVLRSAEVTSEIVLLNDKSYAVPASGIVMNKLSLVIRRDEDDDDHKLSVILDTNDLQILKSKIEIALNETEEMKRSYEQFVQFIIL